MRQLEFRLFDHPIVNEVEKEIASLLGEEVYESDKEILSRLVNQGIEDSNLDESILLKYFTEQKQKFIEFAVMLYRSESGRDIEEEYPKGEEIPKSQRPVAFESYGPGIGFGINYAIYFHFLSSERIDDLSEYLKKRRFPYYKKFQSRLQRYFNEIKRSTTTE